jgi:hypothetical protein
MMKRKISANAYWVFVTINLIWLAVLWWDQPIGTRKWAYLLVHLLNLAVFTRLALKHK